MLQQKKHEQEIVAAVKQFANSTNSNDSVVIDISMLVAATSKLPLTNLEIWERLIRWQLNTALQVPKQSNWKFWDRPKLSFPWVDLCHGDGFIREKALKNLSEAAPNSFFFALAVRRLNDWVPEIRKAACDALPLIAKTSNPEIIVDVLFITLPYWDSWGRMGDAEKQVLMQIISLEKVATSLKKRLITSTSGPMSSILAQVGRTNALDHSLIDIAESAIQPSLRAKAYRCQFEGRFVWSNGKKWLWTDKVYGEGKFIPSLEERSIPVLKPFMDNLKMATIDRSPIVRRVAGEMLIRELENLGDQAIIFAKILASDPSPSVAERGKFALKELGTSL
ncbi:hypothetical protein [Serratia sp. UGAL515B_01]|uniref:hypothetical protein n=1 Tax=Serratia sp. UGAL515B_01 TaxID=2986763 RepID=UPI002954BD19|nr:hypothetical protein [Serratia sp. UGAL515B_01]WON75845.1 hypothetical protein OK023_11225 [Serratia sp. UGAL515B_01]